MNSQTAASATPVVARHLKWDMLLDPAGRLSLDEVLFPTQQGTFVPYDPWFQPRQNGTVWLRLSAESRSQLAGGWYLDTRTDFLGQAPDEPHLWLVPPDSVAGRSIEPAYPGLYPLPDAVAGTLYIRSPGVPGPAFMPLLRAPGSLTALDTSLSDAALIFFASLMLLLLLRGLLERREWRLWAALYALGVLAQIFWGLPASARGVIQLWDIPGLLAPGLALLMLPHVGRHILRTRQYAPFLDLQLILLGMPGLVLALAPLVPGYGWTLRYLPLWPLLMLMYVPTLLGALFKNLPGSRRFLFMCLCPPTTLLLGLGLASLPLVRENNWLLSFMPWLPWTGLGLSVFFMAFVPTPRWLPLPDARKEGVHPQRGEAAQSATAHAARAFRSDEALSLGPNLTQTEKPLELVTDTPRPLTAPSSSPLSPNAPVVQKLEGDLREVLDTLFVNIAALDQTALPQPAQEATAILARSGRKLAGLINDLPRRFSRPENEPSAPALHRFDLRELMLQVHNTVAPKAEAKNLGLSWFSAPHLHRYFEGDGLMLYKVLLLLAESAINATQNRGMVQIRAHRLSESNDPGQLVFSVIDSGNGKPPFGRNGMALVRAWELVGATDGSLRMDSTPTGTVVTCSLRFKAVSNNLPVPPQAPAEGDESSPATTPSLADTGPVLRIIVGSDVPANRQLMAYYLDELPHEVLEARSSGEAASLYSRTPGALLVLDGDLPEDDMANAIAAIRTFEGEQAYPPTSIVVLVNDEQQSSRLRRAGCTHTLFKPILRTELRHLVLRLAPLPKPRSKTPKPSAQAGQAAQASRQNRQGKGAASRGGALQNLPDLSLAPTTDVQEAEAPQEKKLWGLLPSFTRSQAEKKSQAGTSGSMALSGQATKGAKNFESAAPGSSSSMPADEFASPAGNGNLSGGTPSGTRQTGTKAGPQADVQPAQDGTGKPVRAVFQPGGQPSSGSRPLSNVGEPMPIPRSGRKQTEHSVTHDDKPGRRSAPQPAPTKALLDRSRVDRSPSDSVEWVGEPMPIPKKTSAAPVEAAASSSSGTRDATAAPLMPDSKQASAPPADAAEWVGEPMPIPKKTSVAPVEVSGASVARKASLGPLMPDSKQTSVPPADAAEWVGEPMPIARQTPATPQSTSQVTPQKTSSPLTALSSPEGSADIDEWVGTPKPIITSRPVPPAPSSVPTPLTETPGTDQSLWSAADPTPDGREEWVGEPMPVPRKQPEPSQPAADESPLPQSAAEAFTDSAEQALLLPLEGQRISSWTTPKGGYNLIIEAEEAQEPLEIVASLPVPSTTNDIGQHDADKTGDMPSGDLALTLTSTPLSLLPEARPAPFRAPRGPLRLDMGGPGMPAIVDTVLQKEETPAIITLTEQVEPEVPAVRAQPLDTFDPFVPLDTLTEETAATAASFLREHEPQGRHGLSGSSLTFIPEAEPQDAQLMSSPLPEEVTLLPRKEAQADGAVLAPEPAGATTAGPLSNAPEAPLDAPADAEQTHPTESAPAAENLDEDLAKLMAAFEDMETGIAAGNAQGVLAAASAMSMVAEGLRLHMLAGQARCMEDLADNGDMQAVREFLPELRDAVNRVREDV